MVGSESSYSALLMNPKLTGSQCYETHFPVYADLFDILLYFQKHYEYTLLNKL